MTLHALIQSLRSGNEMFALGVCVLVVVAGLILQRIAPDELRLERTAYSEAELISLQTEMSNLLQSRGAKNVHFRFEPMGSAQIEEFEQVKIIASGTE